MGRKMRSVTAQEQVLDLRSFGLLPIGLMMSAERWSRAFQFTIWSISTKKGEA